MSNENIMITKGTAQEIDSLIMVLLSMSDHYKLPSALHCLIGEFEMIQGKLKAENTLSLIENKKIVPG